MALKHLSSIFFCSSRVLELSVQKLVENENENETPCSCLAQTRNSNSQLTRNSNLGLSEALPSAACVVHIL